MMVRVDNYRWIDPTEISQIWFRLNQKPVETLMCIELTSSRRVELRVDGDVSKSSKKVDYLIKAKRIGTLIKVEPTAKEKVYFANEKNPFVEDWWDNSFRYTEEYL